MVAFTPALVRGASLTFTVRARECGTHARGSRVCVRTRTLRGGVNLAGRRCRSPLKRYPIISRESVAAENDCPRAAPVVLAAHARFPLSLRVRLLCSSPFAPCLLLVLSRERASLSRHAHLYGVSRAILHRAYFEIFDTYGMRDFSTESLIDVCDMSQILNPPAP